MPSLHSSKGFTLIELLIVVAIIAILASIAVPNFLEAQTRSKISRFKADVRTAATALEMYNVDHNRYPPPDSTPPGSDVALAGGEHDFNKGPAENYLPREITTPVAYLTSLPIDIFPSPNVVIEFPGIPAIHPPHYINDQFNQAQYTTVEEQFFSARSLAAIFLAADPVPAQYDTSVKWHIHSHGPDLDHDDFAADQGYPTVYDATNGTISDGDIFFFGPGRGFIGS
ncbi:MAG: prepilin-type N-terminal cleavage/methylation domain-containing protein [Candidatus Sumerlaeia bacterium]|nr:prepilin-type N-terminal cleavage/methylation domain-containing protein [Candidatus Sumerlaeia bacterium]